MKELLIFFLLIFFIESKVQNITKIEESTKKPNEKPTNKPNKPQIKIPISKPIEKPTNSQIKIPIAKSTKNLKIQLN
jgi:hypothetical protein